MRVPLLIIFKLAMIHSLVFLRDSSGDPSGELILPRDNSKYMELRRFKRSSG